MKFLLSILRVLLLVCLTNCQKQQPQVIRIENKQLAINLKADLQTNIQNLGKLENPYQCGKDDASNNAESGRMILETYGLPPKEEFEWQANLKNEYQIESYNFGCVVSDKMKAYVKGYNEVSEAEIKRKYGDDILERTWRQINKRKSPLPRY